MSHDPPPTVEHVAVPAATVILLRDGEPGLEVLMLRRSPTGAFADMWVFPGGRVDPDDVDPAHPEDELAAARTAAVRETLEEAALVVDPAALVTYAHWLPPAQHARRFSTWFFVAPAPAALEVAIDGAEIHDHAWLRPADVLEGRAAGRMELAPPTWVTLYHLAAARDMDDVITAAAGREPRRYVTHVARDAGAMVTLWEGDAGYEDYDATRQGERHRLVMDPDGWRFECTLAGWQP
jgi:8-oxo-dGTP pyrophosphatase MutT (NUDIX family)